VRPQDLTDQAPLTDRLVQVAFAVARGDKDTSTARRLGTSLRTIEREVSAVLRHLFHLDVRTRQEAALALLGERS
jgi:DNA-binding NarL/FixJ family response regulator